MSELHSLDAEIVILSSVFQDNSLIDLVSSKLKQEHFHDPVLGLLYERTKQWITKGQDVNHAFIKGIMRNDEALLSLGGSELYDRIETEYVGDSQIEFYANIIIDYYKRRQLVEFAADLISKAQKPAEFEIDELIAEHEASLTNMQVSSVEASQVFAGDLVLQLAKDLRAKKQIGINTGIQDLDAVIGSLNAGHLWIVGGRPAMGKSAVALSVALNVARQGHGVLMFSMDMARDQVATRFSSMFVDSRLEYRNITSERITNEQQAKISEAGLNNRALPIVIDDKRGRNVDDIISVTRRTKAMFKKQGIELGLVIIDHLQKIKPSRQRSNEYGEMTETVRRMKDGAMQMGVPVMLCSQLSRNLESREDKRPLMSDLRDSGAIEEEADIISMLYRDEYYTRQMMETETDSEKWANLEARQEANKNVLEILNPKVRQGEPRPIKVFIDIGTNRINSMARYDQYGEIY